MTDNILILASSSSRRKEILKKINIPFAVNHCQIDETNHNDLPPKELVTFNAKAKARKVGKKFTDNIVIGADTIVVIDEEILGKPKDRSHAVSMLSALSGRTHEVLTGVCLIKNKCSAQFVFSVKTRVSFYPINNKMIAYYVDNYHPFDKAGAYGIQDWSASFVESIHGCFYNVMGFPLARFVHIINHHSFREQFQIDNWLGKVME